LLLYLVKLLIFKIMNKKETITRILSINNDYDRKWLETLDEDFLNKLLIDNMIVSQGVSNKFMMYFN
jgi:hypothetical protein